MNKKFMSLFLSTAMLLGTLAGCSSNAGEEEDVSAADTEESSRIAMTLSLWLPTDENTTEEAVELVEAELNRLTQARYDTAIELHAIPRSEYQTTIDAKMTEIGEKLEAEELAAEERRQAAKEESRRAKEESREYTPETEEESETVQTEDETYVNDLGISVVRYPDVTDTQMDIFLVQGYENYTHYIEDELIQQLDSELSGSSKILKTYIYPTYLTLANESGTYAIPNNHPAGEYQYLLVNKELVDTFDYESRSLNSPLRCEDFIRDMAYLKEHGEEALQDVTLVLGPIEPANMVYWSIDDEWSIIASQITNTMNYNVKCSPRSIFSTNVYVNTTTMMKQFEDAGWVGDGVVDEGEKFAVGVLSGDASIAEKYQDDYYITIYGKPVMDEDDIYGAMFAVSSYSKSLARSMEIITYLNTDSEIRTVLQYGVEGVHWEVDQENPDVINILNHDYSMNLLETGNVYMTYPGEGIPMSQWEYGKQQNLDSIASPFLKFGKSYITDENRALLEEVAKMSKEYKAAVDKMNAEEFTEAVAQYKTEIKENQAMTELLDTDEITYSVAYIYNEFFAEHYPS